MAQTVPSVKCKTSKQKGPESLDSQAFFDLIRQRPTLPYGDRIVPSALEGLTAEFGMGSGVTPPLSPPETVEINESQKNFEIRLFSHN